MNRKVIYALFFVMSLVLLADCGGGGGSSSSAGTGTVSLDIADAKPFIDATEQPEELWIVFNAVQVHTSGGGWVSLKMPETPFEINLLAFCDGRTTEFATPTEIPSGHITQIRFEISRAYMAFPDSTEEEIDLDVPSGTLKTDQQIDWTLPDGGALSLTVHFDLSQSVVQTGNGGYKLKPVLHLFNNEPDGAASICGDITPESFVAGNPEKVDVIVTWFESEADEVGQAYTHVTVLKESDTEPTHFCIYWLVPLAAGERYSVLIDNGDGDETNDYPEDVQGEELQAGGAFDLNGGDPITIPPPSPM